MARTVEEINEKLKAGKAVVFTAEEAVQMAAEQGVKKCAEKIDVVTAATFGAMCSSGAMLNFGHSEPPIRMGEITLNGVEAYGGLAAVDTYIGATQPGRTTGIEYGGAHVIEDLVAGKEVALHATSNGTDCYVRKEINTKVRLSDLNQAYLLQPAQRVPELFLRRPTRPARPSVPTWARWLPANGQRDLHHLGRAVPAAEGPGAARHWQSARAFFWAAARVTWCSRVRRPSTTPSSWENGDMHYAGYTLAVIGDLRGMSTEYLRAATFDGYGVSLYVSIGVPLPVLDEDFMADLAVSNDHLYTYVYDYGREQALASGAGARVVRAGCRSGEVEVEGKRVHTAPLSSLLKARKIAGELKTKLLDGSFVMTQPRCGAAASRRHQRA